MVRVTAGQVLALLAACAIMFVLGSMVAYAQRGYVAVGGEYVFVAAQVMALACWAGGEEDVK